MRYRPGRSDEEQRGYEEYGKPFHSRYDGGYDYGTGWDEHARDEGRERDRREEERAEEEAEERRQERRAMEAAQERQLEEEAYWQQQEQWSEVPSVEPEVTKSDNASDFPKPDSITSTTSSSTREGAATLRDETPNPSKAFSTDQGQKFTNTKGR